jgi:hypothetical protein
MKKRTVKLPDVKIAFIAAAGAHQYARGAFCYHFDTLSRMAPAELSKAYQTYSMLIAERDMPLRVA